MAFGLGTVLLTIPAIGNLYERGKRDELAQPITREEINTGAINTLGPGQAVGRGVTNAGETVATGVGNVVRGATDAVDTFIEDAKQSAFKKLLLWVAVGIVVVMIYRKVKK